MISIGLLGCGRIGQVHAGSIARMGNARLTAVADAVPEAAQKLAETSGAQTRTAEDIIAATDIDAVIVATPTSLHYDQIHALAAAGKAIFCEKPIDLSSDRAAECMAAVTKAGVPFMTAFNRRFDPHFAHLQAQVADGVIGDAELLVITSRDPAPPPLSYIRQSGGLFRDMMIHDFDMARFILGEDPVDIYAAGACLVDPGIATAGDIDSAMVTLKTASGKLCQINNSRRATYGYDQRLEVHGSKGMLQVSNQVENLVTHAATAGFASAPNQHFFLERYQAAYLAELRSFVDALTKGAAPQPSVADGVAAQRMADAAAESLATGKPVKLAMS
ncbi:inositol 2-dehydrogenase [Roseobacter denitrificans]|uniref:Myo-inositol dehydrogenase n=1 Tax=Roseobacter denitrificans (strain ATCC 33942 / OCh 114) TaxID=375451 RepID=Q16DJ7_ROSDO|nr:inositol 2-dehydrogenase [Roseobacter denitrificans]ABG29946.1 myo-inositol dehydrogenase [Roseobacter denitrificans OCh 114]AVL53158.1 inositol 2-dehydrogenase [Roseobacter denitrificans]SFG38704.1 myo-inositol 2-dehydrogenase [Roseobacter denitrificans OCh 114]